MTALVAPCGLCLKPSKLQDSHLLPAALYKLSRHPVGQISLGGEYQEQFCQYLLGKAPFPQNARIGVHVSAEAQPDLLTTVYPCTTRVDGVRRHKFYIPGVLFILFLGRDVQKQFDAGALNGRQRQLMWLCPWQNDSLFVGSMDLVKTSTPSGKLRR